LRGKWFWGVVGAVGIALPSFILSSDALVSARETGRLKEVFSSEVMVKNQAARLVIPSESLIFLGGVRNADSHQVLTPEVYFVGGPTEPSLASAVGGSSLINQHVPLTTASAENIRTSIVTYKVNPGDVPSVIAASFGITTNTLLWANNLSDGGYIRPDDELIILPVSGVRYKVKSGDTLSSISSNYKGDVERIVAFNGIENDGQIASGDYLIIPDGEMPVRTYASSVAYSVQYTAYSKNLDGYFIHPTAGVGYKSRGIHPNNAIDIAASCWTPIYAAAAGKISISDGYGWNGGYGNYIKIDHPNGTKTLYAHAIQLLVSAGEVVDQGQLVAYMGSTGRSTGCHIHWEVYGALNPLR